MKKRYFLTTWLIAESRVELYSETSGTFLNREETVTKLSKKCNTPSSQIALLYLFEFASEKDALDYGENTMT